MPQKVIVGYEKGNLVAIVSKTPQFMRDVSHMFTISIFLVVAHLIYLATGSFMPAFFYIANQDFIFKILKHDEKYDRENISKKDEKAF